MGRSRPLSCLLALLPVLCGPAAAGEFSLEAGLLNRSAGPGGNKTSLEKAGFGLKEIIGDGSGDRLLFYLRAEAAENFSEGSVEQLYAKYKGPMGKWNVTLGRTLVPFGLITDYDTEWTIVKTQEDHTVGFKSDDGLKLSGYYGPFDYDLLLSRGRGPEPQDVSGRDKLGSAKVAYKAGESEDLKFGLSALGGTVSGREKNLAGIDVAGYLGPLAGRGELVTGRADGRELLSVFAGLDYGVAAALDLNLAYNYFKSGARETVLTAGSTYRTPLYGLLLRGGVKFYNEDIKGDKKNEIYIQLYKRFTGYF